MRAENSMTFVIDPGDIYHVMGRIRARLGGIGGRSEGSARQIEGHGRAPARGGIEQKHAAQAFRARLHVG